MFGDYFDCMYLIELEINGTTDTWSCLDLYLVIDSEAQLRTKLCDKRDDFNFTHCELLYIYM